MKNLIFLILIMCSGCITHDGKNAIRSEHAMSKVLVDKINDPDPSKHPSPAQLEQAFKASASTWESMDIMINNWKP